MGEVAGTVEGVELRIVVGSRNLPTIRGRDLQPPAWPVTLGCYGSGGRRGTTPIFLRSSTPATLTGSSVCSVSILRRSS